MNIRRKYVLINSLNTKEFLVKESWMKTSQKNAEENKYSWKTFVYRQRLLLKNRDSISCSEWDFVFVHRAYQQRVRYAMHTNSQRIQRRGNIEWKICRIILQLRKRKAYYLSDVGRQVTSFFFSCAAKVLSRSISIAMAAMCHFEKSPLNSLMWCAFPIFINSIIIFRTTFSMSTRTYGTWVISQENTIYYRRDS